MIPEAKTAAAGRALWEAFGVNEFEDIRKLTAGLSSALVFCIVVRGCPYTRRRSARSSSFFIVHAGSSRHSLERSAHTART